MTLTFYLPRAEDEDASSEEGKDARDEDEGVPIVKVRRLHQIVMHEYGKRIRGDDQDDEEDNECLTC